tara:strand:- start:7296 stop:8384 length:1089 start_codon:yes stop_codon:yes gene_type:complete
MRSEVIKNPARMPATIRNISIALALSLFTSTALYADNDKDSGKDTECESFLPREARSQSGSLIIDYLELPGWGHLCESPYSTAIAHIFPVDDSAYLVYNNVGYDFPEPESLLKQIEKDPEILFPEAGAIDSRAKVEGASVTLLEGSGKKGQWLAAVVMNRRFEGTDSVSRPTAGILYLVAPDIEKYRQKFIETIKNLKVHKEQPYKLKRIVAGNGNYSLLVPVPFSGSSDYSGIRLTAPNGAFLIMDHHPVSEGVVMAGEMEKWQTRIEKGYYSFLFARGHQKIEKAEKRELKEVNAIRMDASVMLPGPYGISSSARFYIFSTDSGIAVVVMVGPVADRPTLDRIESSIRVEKTKTPLGIQL